MNSIQLNQLKDSLEPIWGIYCDNCTNTQDEATNQEDFARTVYDLGWRVSSDGAVFCPTCAKSNGIMQ